MIWQHKNVYIYTSYVHINFLEYVFVYVFSVLYVTAMRCVWDETSRSVCGETSLAIDLSPKRRSSHRCSIACYRSVACMLMVGRSHIWWLMMMPLREKPRGERPRRTSGYLVKIHSNTHNAK